MRPMRETVAMALLLLAMGRAEAGAPPVYLNEVQPRGPERVELYNSGQAPRLIAGWRIVEGGESHIFPSGTIIPGLGYLAVNLGGILNDLGGEIALIDLKDGVQDAVAYGQLGSAPLPPTTALLGGSPPSLARSPDAAQATPPVPDRDIDGLFWTIDSTPTFGTFNNAPPPELGTSILINEVSLSESSDFVELYNPTGSSTSLAEWSMTNGISSFTLSGGISGFGYRVFSLPGTFDIDDSQLLYLFRVGETRVDQLGFVGVPPAPLAGGPPVCYGRSPDGAGPNLGYDWRSSGGDITLFPLPCTLGSRNGPVSGVPDSGPAVHLSTWGEIKETWRRSR